MTHKKRNLSTSPWNGEYITPFSVEQCLHLLKKKTTLHFEENYDTRFEATVTEAAKGDVDYHYVINVMQWIDDPRYGRVSRRVFRIRGSLDKLSGGNTRIIVDYAGRNAFAAFVPFIANGFLAALLMASKFASPDGDVSPLLIVSGSIVVLGLMVTVYSLQISPRFDTQGKRYMDHFIRQLLQAVKDV